MKQHTLECDVGGEGVKAMHFRGALANVKIDLGMSENTLSVHEVNNSTRVPIRVNQESLAKK